MKNALYYLQAKYCVVLLEHSTSRSRFLHVLLCLCSIPLVNAAEVFDEFSASVVRPILGHTHERRERNVFSAATVAHEIGALEVTVVQPIFERSKLRWTM